jgi:hypothetical protein
MQAKARDALAQYPETPIRVGQDSEYPELLVYGLLAMRKDFGGSRLTALSIGRSKPGASNSVIWELRRL